jgi:hypothetical protein
MSSCGEWALEALWDSNGNLQEGKERGTVRLRLAAVGEWKCAAHSGGPGAPRRVWGRGDVMEWSILRTRIVETGGTPKESEGQRVPSNFTTACLPAGIDTWSATRPHGQ